MVRGAKDGGSGEEGGLCGRRRLGIMYFIMISQQNCNLQRAMSYLLRARAFFARFSLSLSLVLSLSLLLPPFASRPQLSVLSLTGLDREANC